MVSVITSEGFLVLLGETFFLIVIIIITGTLEDESVCAFNSATLYVHFYRTMLARYILWACVCLFFTSRCSTKTNKLRIKQTTPLDSAGTLVF